MNPALTRQNGEEHRQVVQHAASQDEEVPESMMIGQAADKIEDHSQRIGQTSGQEQHQPNRRQPPQQGPGGDHHQPAHGQVDQRMQQPQTAGKKDLEDLFSE